MTRRLEEQYGPAHTISVQPGCLLADILGAGIFQVNSLHGQASTSLARNSTLTPSRPTGRSRRSPCPTRRGYLLGVQWHPEWHWADNEVSRAILGLVASTHLPHAVSCPP